MKIVLRQFYHKDSPNPSSPNNLQVISKKYKWFQTDFFYL